MSDNNGRVKILFRFYSNILDEETVETMWAKLVDNDKGLYQLDSIPFYAQLISSDDIVLAEYDHAEQMLTYRETVEHSGNSTLHVVLVKEDVAINDIRNLFTGLGCVSEQVNDAYFSLEIPHNVDYEPVKAKLDELEQSEVLSYQESCLSSKHQ